MSPSDRDSAKRERHWPDPRGPEANGTGLDQNDGCIDGAGSGLNEDTRGLIEDNVGLKEDARGLIEDNAGPKEDTRGLNGGEFGLI